jgi:hypothetical protein
MLVEDKTPSYIQLYDKYIHILHILHKYIHICYNLFPSVSVSEESQLVIPFVLGRSGMTWLEYLVILRRPPPILEGPRFSPTTKI